MSRLLLLVFRNKETKKQTNKRVIMPVYINCPCKPWHSQSYVHVPRNKCLCSCKFVSSSIQHLVWQKNSQQPISVRAGKD